MTRRKRKQRDREQRLAQVRSENRRRFRRIAITGIAFCALILAGVAIYLLFGNGTDGGKYAPAQNVGPGTGTGQISVPISEVGTGAKFYTYDSGGTEVRFFAIKGPDGQTHVAIDACDVCYANHKGYRQSGDKMQCNNCGQSFAINDIGTKNTSGGCWPSHLPVSLQGDNLLIEKSDLDAKVFMFR